MTEVDQVVWKHLREEIIDARRALRKAARSLKRKQSTRIIEHYADAVDAIQERIEAEAEKFPEHSHDRLKFLALWTVDEFPWTPFCPYF